ncbi:hypothetical protein [Streptomyces sp. NPDC087300]|uniref:hypothetical protein n=1 Tax=Streptomyces sp. NPDC087300 TaxID=3365780 RepID=UPI0038196141
MSTPAPPDALPAPQALPDPNKCLQPTMGTGPDKELRLRIDGSTPAYPPLRRGIYLDPNRGLWSDPDPEAEWGTAELVQEAVNVEAATTWPMPPVTLAAKNKGGVSLVALGTLTVQMRMEANQSSGLVRVMGAVGVNTSPRDGRLLGVLSAASGRASGTYAVAFPLTVPGFGTSTLTCRVWVANTTRQPVTLTAAAARVEFAGVSRKGDSGA